MKWATAFLTVMCLALCAPAEARSRPLNRHDAAVGAHAWMHRFFPKTPYRVVGCHDGPLDPYCMVKMGRSGCGCDFNHPNSLGPFELVIESVRGGGFVVHDGFWDLRLVLRWRPL